MSKYAILILILFTASLKSFAQFTGGSEDGFNYAILAQSNCAPLGSDFVFYGGNANGYSDASLTQSSCLPLISNFVFYGGNANGYSDASLTQSVCPPLASDFVFYGGNANGYSDASLTQSVCPPLASDFVFYGGNANGYSDVSLTQSVCPPLASDFVFYGGNADGYSDASLTQSVCPPLASNFVFYGGNADGYSNASLTQSVCLPLVSDFVFHGGIKEGFGFSVLQQTICANNIPLPIELISFTASCENQNIVLKWTTASEINNDYFTLERSLNESSWQAIDTVDGAGNSFTVRNYLYADNLMNLNLPSASFLYYKLKQTDFDGHFKYSNTIAVEKCNETQSEFSVYPNPSNGSFILLYNGDKNRVRSIEIFNVLGERVYFSGCFKSTIDITDKPTGMYYVHLNLDTNIITTKVITEK
jgi:hypothetical protein